MEWDCINNCDISNSVTWCDWIRPLPHHMHHMHQKQDSLDSHDHWGQLLRGGQVSLKFLPFRFQNGVFRLFFLYAIKTVVLPKKYDSKQACHQDVWTSCIFITYTRTDQGEHWRSSRGKGTQLNLLSFVRSFVRSKASNSLTSWRSNWVSQWYRPRACIPSRIQLLLLIWMHGSFILPSGCIPAWDFFV